jgi:2-methylcitrate dehydratase PrpD
VLEAPQGFFQAFTGGHYRPEALQREEDDPRVCEEMSFKYYPLEYIIHPLVEMANDARSAVGHRLGEIMAIEASVTSRFITLFQPKAVKVPPPDRFMALISVPYAIARALTKSGTGHLFIRDFRQDYVLDEHIRELANKVQFVREPTLDAVFPHHVGGVLRVKGAGDAVLWEGRIDDVYGSLQRPLSEAHLLEKFHANCARLGAGRSNALLDTLQELPAAKDASWIVSMRRWSCMAPRAWSTSAVRRSAAHSAPDGPGRKAPDLFLAKAAHRPAPPPFAACYNSVRPASNWRAMVRRWISAVPSGMRMTRAKR